MKSSTELLLGSGVGTVGVPRWHGVPASRVPGSAAQQPANRQPGAAQRAVHAQRLEGVGAAARLEPAARWQDRGDPGAVDADEPDQEPGDRAGAGGLFGGGRARLVKQHGPRPVHNPPPSLLAVSRNLRSAASKSWLSSALDASAAEGKARTIN